MFKTCLESGCKIDIDVQIVRWGAGSLIRSCAGASGLHGLHCIQCNVRAGWHSLGEGDSFPFPQVTPKPALWGYLDDCQLFSWQKSKRPGVKAGGLGFGRGGLGQSHPLLGLIHSRLLCPKHPLPAFEPASHHLHCKSDLHQ